MIDPGWKKCYLQISRLHPFVGGVEDVEVLLG